jgi:integrase
VKKNRQHQPAHTAESQSEWVKTPVANLVRYKTSGIFFARVRIGGKLFRQSLKTDVMSVAKLRVSDFIKEKREEMGDDSPARTGRMTVGDAICIFGQGLDGQHDIKEGAKVYRRKCLALLLKSWPGLDSQPVGKVSKDDCLTWARDLAPKYSPTVYNNTVGTLRMILDIAVEKGARAQNPARTITKKRIIQRELVLPSPEEFEAFVSEIGVAGAWCSRECADLVKFLAFGGFRKTEAANVVWSDCDFENGRVRIRVTKNGIPRSIPMIPDMRRLLERLRAERSDEPLETPVMRVRECQKAMDRAAKLVGMARITHHDLRHLFATRCIESGVDIPTVSRWLGHKDGGALAMKVYGHLRDQHSVEMAQKVTFSKPPLDNGQDGSNVPTPNANPKSS